MNVEIRGWAQRGDRSSEIGRCRAGGKWYWLRI